MKFASADLPDFITKKNKLEFMFVEINHHVKGTVSK